MDLSPANVAALLRDTASLHVNQDVPALEGFREAAVIIPLVARAGQLHVIYNRRAANLANHPGQVSFPGGRRDPEDASLLDTARREFAEELGVAPGKHEVLRRLPARKVISHFLVTPFISLVQSDAALTPQASEVAYPFEVSLAALLAPGAAARHEAEVFGTSTTFYSWETPGPRGTETIWGATGRMTADFLLALGADHEDWA